MTLPATGQGQSSRTLAATGQCQSRRGGDLSSHRAVPVRREERNLSSHRAVPVPREKIREKIS